jgi:AcrR family transcriptional regulator
VPEPVKGTTEAGRRREARARQTRDRIVTAAVDLFVERGYAATTVAAIAGRAAVAPATVYQAFGTKHAILATALDVAIAGDSEPVALLDRDWVHEARQVDDAGQRLAIVVDHVVTVVTASAAIKEVMRDAAATVPEARALVDQDDRRRLRTQRALVDLLVEARPLRQGLDRDDAVALVFTLVNSHSYALAADHLGWSADRWRAWLAATLAHHLFGADP